MYKTQKNAPKKDGYYWFTGTITPNKLVEDAIVLLENPIVFFEGVNYAHTQFDGLWAGPITHPNKMCATEEVWHDAVYMLLGGADPEYVKALLKRKLG